MYILSYQHNMNLSMNPLSFFYETKYQKKNDEKKGTFNLVIGIKQTYW